MLRIQDNAKVIAQLTARYQDPGAHLIAFLDEVAPPGVDWDDLGHDDDPGRAYRRAFWLLVEIGTRASLTWVLSRLDLFNDESELSYEAYRQAQRVHPGAGVGAVAGAELGEARCHREPPVHLQSS